jgi:ABC-type bacteriocin/lantibiotic exporter with double-glycine peptidase domain
LKGFEAVIIDELSFNQYPGYLLHSKSLTKVEVINNQRAEITLPENSLRYAGKLSIIRSTSYFKDLQKSIGKSVTLVPKDQRFQFLQLSGTSGSGKTTLLRDLAD